MDKQFHRRKLAKKRRIDASTAGLSTKTYLAQKFPSVGWSYMIEVIRRRCKKSGIQCTVTPSQLASQFKLQNGMCPITGWALEPKKSGSGLVPRTMTIDRKDPSLGYISTNIQLVCFIANNAKYIWSVAQLLEFCQAVLTQRGPTTDDVIRAEDI